MCGIVSLLSWSHPHDPALVTDALGQLNHRGPDGQQRWSSENLRVTLGHSRLALVDIDGGQQPLANERETIWAVVNGEFYDHEIWTHKLEDQGHKFRTRSDSEILVHLYEEYGLDCVERLNGEFTFILWDITKQKLVAGRDRFGIKPLVWSEYREQLFIASEAKALFAMGVPALWDSAAFFQSASLQYLPARSSLFAGIEQLPPGHLLIAEKGQVAVHSYWDLNLPTKYEESFSGTKQEASGAVISQLRKSVNRRLRGDTTVVAQLSGGIDSTMVAALAAESQKLDCFTVSFTNGGSAHDELPTAKIAAKHIKANLHVVEATNRALADSLEPAVEMSEGLAINAHLPAKWLLSRKIQQSGFRAVLTGEGSDEVFLGYPHLVADFASPVGDENATYSDSSASRGTMLPSGRGLSTQYVQRLLGKTPCFLAAKATLGYKMHGLLERHLLAEFTTSDPFENHLSQIEIQTQLRERTPVDIARYLWIKSALAGYILKTLGDGTEMAHSVEGRVPFLDHEVFELAKSMPNEWHISDGVEKSLLREAAKGLIPESIRTRKKHPFVAPTVFLSEEFHSLAQDIFRSRNARENPFIDPDKALKVLDRLPSMAGNERVGWDATLMLSITTIMLGDKFRLGDIQ